MSNTVYDVDFTRALPAPLRNDEKMLALGSVIAGELRENIRLARQAIIYPHIDELPGHLLDILAWDLHIDWYDDRAATEIKRQVIKDSVKVHKRMGTKFAILTALRSVFPQCGVEEWYEYGGKHHRFRIILDLAESEAPAPLAEIRRTLRTFNRLTAHLEAIILRFVVDKTPIIPAPITKHAVRHTTTPRIRGITADNKARAVTVVKAVELQHAVKHTSNPQERESVRLFAAAPTVATYIAKVRHIVNHSSAPEPSEPFYPAALLKTSNAGVELALLEIGETVTQGYVNPI